MKKVLRYICIITLIVCLSICNNVFAAYKKITLEEVKTYFDQNLQEDDGVKSVSIEDGAVKIESEENEIIKLFYDSENDTFYVEETFDNTMTEEVVESKFERNVDCTFLWILCSIRQE